MKNIHEVKNDLAILRRELSKFEGLDHNFECNFDDPEEKFEFDQINGILQQIEDVITEYDYFNSEVKFNGRIERNSNGRYSIDDFELHAGTRIEVLDITTKEWTADRIEFFNDDYGLYFSRKQDLTGTFARIRK